MRIAEFCRLIVLSLSVSLPGPTLAQSTSGSEAEAYFDAGATTFVINLRDAEIQVLSEQVSEITGRTLILDPNVQGKITVISREPLDPEGVWQLYQSVLRVQGYAALRSGDIWRIVPQANVNQAGPTVISNGGNGQDFVTKTITLNTLPAEAAATALRPLVASFGYLQALAQPNAIVITDSAENVQRIEALARSLDRNTGGSLVTIPLTYGKAPTVAEALTRVVSKESTGKAGIGPVIAFDARTNILLVRAEPTDLAEIRRLISELDQPSAAPDDGLTTIPLRFADAREVAEAIQAVLGGRPASGAETDGVAPPVLSASEGARISFDARSNTLLVRADAQTTFEIRRLAETLDRPNANALATIPLRFADARGIADALAQIVDNPSSDLPSRTAPRISVDERSNTLLVRGDPAQIEELRGLAAELDQPGAAKVVPVTRVYRLRNGDAEVIAPILRSLVGKPSQARNPVARELSPENTGGRLSALGRAATELDDQPDDARLDRLRADNQRLSNVADTQPEQRDALADADIAIESSSDLNAIILRGAPDTVAQIEALIFDLDRRRAQVLIEAAIVEITGDAAEQLGVQFGFGDSAPDAGFAATSFSRAGVSLSNILGVLGVPAAGLLSGGATVGLSIDDNFGILLQALATSSKANLLSTPSLTTLDNEEAQIVVGQNVPFRTGSFTIDGNSTDPFTTIEREDVGITLRVAPRVHEGDTVRLEVSQEVSSLVQGALAGAADLITNRRSIDTTVLADNGETIVLGGLITDDRISGESKVPILGDIPIAGRLFRADNESRTKRTLFVFLRPTILRDRADVAAASRDKYERLRGAEFDPVAEGSLLFGPTLTKLPLEIGGIY